MSVSGNKEIIESIKNKFLSNQHCLSANPFKKSTNREVIFEEFNVWSEDFFNKLKVITHLSQVNHFYALEYQDNGSGLVDFINLHKIMLASDFESYTQNGFDIGYTINGLEFYLFDDSMTWCIGSTTDVQFLTADPRVMGQYFTSVDEKKTITSSFIAQFDQESMNDGYRKMKDYIMIQP